MCVTVDDVQGQPSGRQGVIDLQVADSPECDRATKAIFEVLADVDLQLQVRRCHSDALAIVTALKCDELKKGRNCPCEWYSRPGTIN